jgi:hypothetical protein
MTIRHAPIARYRIHRSDGNRKGESSYTDDTATAVEAAKQPGVVVEELLADKAAIVAELERLYDEWLVRAESRNPQVALGKALGTCDGLDLAIQVVQAGGALPLESEEKVEGN